MKKVNKLVLLLIIILGICIVDFVIISDKEKENVPKEAKETEVVEQVENMEGTEDDFSVAFETVDEKEASSKTNELNSSKKESIEVITSWQFEEKVLKEKSLVVVDFYADWCGPCKQLEPILEKVASENPNVKFYRIDTDSKTDAAINKVNDTYNIRYLPTIILFKNGEEKDRLIGLADEEAITKLFTK